MQLAWTSGDLASGTEVNSLLVEEEAHRNKPCVGVFLNVEQRFLDDPVEGDADQLTL